MMQVGQRVKCRSAVWDESKYSRANEVSTGVIEWVHPKGRFYNVRLTFGSMSYLESFPREELRPTSGCAYGGRRTKASPV